MKILPIPIVLNNCRNPNSCEIIKKSGSDNIYIILDHDIQYPLMEGSFEECEVELKAGLDHGVFNFDNPDLIVDVRSTHFFEENDNGNI